MPNWCSNNVTLRHSDPAFIQRAVKSFNREKLLNEFVPMPEELKEGEGWYEWRINNWGTKWDVGSSDDGFCKTKNQNCVVLTFESAWSPPIEAYRAMEALGFEIEAHYYEPGLAFFGSYMEGVEDTIDYGEMTAEEIRTEFPEHDERWCISEWMEEKDSEEEDSEDYPVSDEERSYGPRR